MARVVRSNSMSSTGSSDPLGLETDDRPANLSSTAIFSLPLGGSAPTGSPNHRDPTSFLVPPDSEANYRVKQHIAYLTASASAASTPARQLSPRPNSDDVYGGGLDSFGLDTLPEGAFETEQHNLTASFSAARTTTIDYTPPSISSMALGSGLDGGTAPLIVGDSSGRVVVFEENTFRRPRLSRSNSDLDALRVQVSHRAYVPETDCLRSKLIEEKVTSTTVLKPRSPGVTSYLVSNESTIKLYRIRTKANAPPIRRSNMVPTTAFTGRHRRPIHSVSTCADQETFMSADDFVVNWWHLAAEDSTRATCLVDKTPLDADDVTEIYLSARFSPMHGSLFILGASSGRCDLGDLRDPPCRKARSFTHQLKLEPPAEGGTGYDDILLSVADAAFLNNEYVVTRDYMTCKLWDLRRPAAPVATCPVMESMLPHLEQLYDDDHIFHHFDLAVDPRTSCVVTGLYDGVVAAWYPQQQFDGLEYYKLSSSDETAAGGVTGKIEAPQPPSKSELTESFFERRVERVAIAQGGSRITGCYGDNIVVMERNKSTGSSNGYPSTSGRRSPFSTDDDRTPAHERSGSRPLVPHSFRTPERFQLKRAETSEI